MEITYSMQGDYLLPNLTLPEQDNREIGVWGRLHERWLKEHHKIIYYNLMTSCRLHAHLADVNEEAAAMYDRLVRQLSEKEGVTELLKAKNQMAWARKMNSITARAREVVLHDIIYAA